MQGTSTVTIELDTLRTGKEETIRKEILNWNKFRICMAKGFWKYGDLMGNAMFFKTTLVENGIHASNMLRRAENNAIFAAWDLVVRTIEAIKSTTNLRGFYAFEEFTNEWSNESPTYKDRHYWSKTQIHYANQLLSNPLSFIALNNGRTYELINPAELDRMRKNEVERWLIKTLKGLKLKFEPTASRCVEYDSDQYRFKPDLDITLSNGEHIKLPFRHKIKGNIKIVLDGRLEIHYNYKRPTPKKVKLKDASRDQIYGTDWNLKKNQMLAGEDGVYFGDIRQVTKKKLKLQVKHQERTKLKQVAENARQRGDDKKAERIEKNNLNSKNLDRIWMKLENEGRIAMQTAIHRLGKKMLAEGKIVNGTEFLYFKGKSRNKEESRMVHMSCYGKLADYREHILPLYGVQCEAVNPAYTSIWIENSEKSGDQSTNTKTGFCGIGIRKGDEVSLGGLKVSSGSNAGRNIGDRVLDTEITIHQTKEQVKETLLKRTRRKAKSIGESDGVLVTEHTNSLGSDSGLNPEVTNGKITTTPSGTSDKCTTKHT